MIASAASTEGGASTISMRKFSFQEAQLDWGLTVNPHNRHRRCDNTQRRKTARALEPTYNLGMFSQGSQTTFVNLERLIAVQNCKLRTI